MPQRTSWWFCSVMNGVGPVVAGSLCGVTNMIVGDSFRVKYRQPVWFVRQRSCRADAAWIEGAAAALRGHSTKNVELSATVSADSSELEQAQVLPNTFRRIAAGDCLWMRTTANPQRRLSFATCLWASTTSRRWQTSASDLNAARWFW